MLAPVCAALALALAATPARPHAAARPAAHAATAATAKHRVRPAPAPTLAQAEAALRALQRDPAKRRYRHQWEKAIHRLEQAARGKDRAPALLAAARARYALYRFSQVEADRTLALRLADRARRAGAKEAAPFAAAVRREAGDHPSARVTAAPAPRPAPRGGEVAQRPAPRTSTAASTPTTPAPAATASPAPTASATPTPKSPPTANPPPSPQPSPPRNAGEGAERAATAAPRSPDRPDEPPSTDPVLDRIVAQLSSADPAPDAAGAEPAPVDDPALRKILEQLRSRPPPADEGAARGPIRRVVVDAGHGGHDTGAIGPSGVREKDVTLAMARRLSERLRATGFEVVLTRSDDRYLALDERTAAANRARGDLFVSLHANAHPRRDQAGVETYVLDVAHDRYAKRLAARENGALADEGEPSSEAPEVRMILADLDAKASAEPSRRLAAGVQRELTGGIRAHFGEVRDLGVKSALFYVLLGARMPAVLVETSFISNRAEERRLASPRFQDEVARGVARAVKAFAEHEARVAAR